MALAGFPRGPPGGVLGGPGPALRANLGGDGGGGQQLQDWMLIRWTPGTMAAAPPVSSALRASRAQNQKTKVHKQKCRGVVVDQDGPN